MAAKRKRNASVRPLDVPPEINPQNATPGSSSWGWVGTEVSDARHITSRHRMTTCNFRQMETTIFCPSKYSVSEVKKKERGSTPSASLVNGELKEDIIVISDDDSEEYSCSKKLCKSNPYCLNYLGQEFWEKEDAEEAFLKLAKLGRNPNQFSRESDLPVGLKNLGATCYANASLQVWYRDLAFRSGVFSCEPPESVSDEKYKESPIFQLQVTFAALQEGNKNVFNPKCLVESLQLRTSEQQDAQEFSKLFMSHLDAEFRKQTSPSVKSLITTQFQGSQVYGTICHACKNRSERASDFLEIEINFDRNAKLEDCLRASLQPEILEGDNRYFCSRCETLQEATRYTELQRLPPVIHFSLLRFVYDVSTMERRKSKHSISFPSVIDMQNFLGSKNQRENATISNDTSKNLYELRGILLHKGASAYHGHYEAQVNDVLHGSWFQFNDESVTKIKSLGDKIPAAKSQLTPKLDETEDIFDSSRKNRFMHRKRKRIESDDDLSDGEDVPFRNLHRETFTSKDAYMLIYAKKSDAKSSNNSSASAALVPPKRVTEIVRALNVAHENDCKKYEAREHFLKTGFQELRSRIRGIYSSWASTELRPSTTFVVSRQSLETWLSKYCIEAALKQNNDTLSSESANHSNLIISISDIVCEHGFLNPLKHKDMKCISQEIFNHILEISMCTFEPILKDSDVCEICVSNMFKEKLYEIEHPKYIKHFEKICLVPDDETGYWISKKWYRDWNLIKPRMHVFCVPDPAPDSSEFHGHVFCEHGGLAVNTTNRRKISAEAVIFLQKLFPSWQPPSTDKEDCVVCEAEAYVSKEDKKTLRRQVEDEKARFKFILEPSLDAWIDSSETRSYAVVPSLFIRAWKRWANNPRENIKPDTIDNTPFFCQHDLLSFDPNCSSDLDSTITIIELTQWDTLQTTYRGGPLIVLTKLPSQDGPETYSHEISVCTACRIKRKTEWDTAEIIIRLRSHKVLKSNSQRTSLITYKRNNGARQSRRLRQNKTYDERRTINVTKSTTVKEIKVMANEHFSIPTICQRLFYQERELTDNSETVGILQILVNDIIDIREAEEIVEVDSDSDSLPASKKRREEGRGFGGTLLGSAESSWSSSPERTPVSTTPASITEKPCLSCTYSNPPDAIECQMCDTLFL